MTQATSTSSASGLIALDWGTSSLRAYRFDADGRVTDKRALPWGVMNLPPAENDSDTSADAGFRRALQAACGDWLRDFPDTPLIAAGMVGSKQGWREAPYLDVPLGIDDIGQTLTAVDTGLGVQLHIVPGLLQCSTLPNVIRGEETQVAGILDQLQVDDILIGLPGTHSKWVHVRDRRIAHFDTFMTGEMYAVLCNHTILGRTMQRDGEADAAGDEAFLRGAVVAKTTDGCAGLLSNIFSSRTLGLTGELSPCAQAHYLSGLLIGHEIAALPALTNNVLQQRIALIGDDFLCNRYRQVLALYGVKQVEIAAAATEHGMWKLALHAGLIAPSSP
ncbi:2-dehydro-3-deoxygalactonokinase [Herbaspirillum sp. RV1423]|uniref:2-dehydro-3-deoxygalactonokinase n=1 Tax=Herbaspirillum sp. RV1423 TaxID=1443993 RepID=UPI0004B560C3|nr:2-dehydro-3-deoxygalactonokinase [Herbaspirillum sp. RV1423]